MRFYRVATRPGPLASGQLHMSQGQRSPRPAARSLSEPIPVRRARNEGSITVEPSALFVPPAASGRQMDWQPVRLKFPAATIAWGRQRGPSQTAGGIEL